MPPPLPVIISFYSFTIAQPFSPGHVLTEGEANTLNIHFADLVRDHARHWVTAVEQKIDGLEDPPPPPYFGFLSPGQLADLQSRINDYSSSYSLALRPRPVRRSLLQIEIDVLQAFGNITDPEELQSEARRRLRARISATPTL